MFEAEKAYPEIRPQDILLTGDEVATLLNVSRSFAYQLMRRREIPTVKLGRSVRVRREDLDQFVLSRVTTSRNTFFGGAR